MTIRLSPLILLAAALNAEKPGYPRIHLLNETLVALRLDRASLARHLCVSPATLHAWLAPANPRTMPNHAVHRLQRLLLDTVNATLVGEFAEWALAALELDGVQNNSTSSRKFGQSVAIRGQEGKQ